MKKLLVVIGIGFVLGAHFLNGSDTTKINQLKTEHAHMFASEQLMPGATVQLFGRSQIVELDEIRNGKRIIEFSEEKFKVRGVPLARKFTQLVEYKDKSIGQSHWVNPTSFTLKILAGGYAVACLGSLIARYT